MTQYNPLELDEQLYSVLDKEYDTLEQNRRERLAQVVTKFSSTLLSRQIHVSVGTSQELSQLNVPVPNNKTEAWSDAENIWFNADNIGDLTDADTALAVRGLSLHEIAHILLTPRSGSKLVKWVRSNDYDKAFNLLEDQRVELMLAAKYSNVKYWFTAAVTKYLLSKPNEIPLAYLTVHGKTFLPPDLRRAVRSVFKWQNILPDLERIIDSYTVLNLADSASIPTAMRLIEELHKLLTSTGQPPEAYPDGTTKEGYPGRSGINQVPDSHGPVMKSSERSKPANKATQEQLINKILKQRNQQAQQSNGSEEGEEYEGTGPDGCFPTPNGKNGNDSSDDSNDTNDTNSDKPGNKAGAGKPGTANDVTSIAERHLNNTKQLLNKDINNMIAQFNGDIELTSKKQVKPQRSPYERMTSVAPSVINQVKSFVKQLLLIKSEHDPGWLRRVNTGKLNVYRYMTGSSADEVFDIWDDGREDVLDIEAVILLDNSGSMSWTIDSAHDSMWAIKRSLDKVGASTTVVTFSDDARMLYDSNERAKVSKKYVGTAGGTEPTQAINYAKYIFANSDRAIKILITITDGVWYQAQAADQAISQMRRAGVITALGYVDQNAHYRQENPEVYVNREISVTSVDGHGSEIVVVLNDGSALLTLAKALVKAGIKRNLNK